MATIQSTQTYPKFQYLFRAVARADMAAGAVNVSVEAGTLVEARQKIKKGYIAAFYRGCKQTHTTTPRRRLINPVMLAEAQAWVKNCPGTWIWKLAVHRMKEAYGIIEPKPFPEAGDTNGNFVCVHSDPTNEDYVFLSKYRAGVAK